MSSRDDTVSQCESRIEAYEVAMGDVLAKGYYEDKFESCEDSQDDTRLVDECSGIERQSNPVDDVSSSRILPTNVDTRLDDPPEHTDSVDAAMRIEERLTSVEESPEVTKYSSDCANDSSHQHDSLCPCDMRKLCKLKRVMIDDELKREIRWHRLWTELRDHIRSVFEAALEATIDPGAALYQCDPCRVGQLRENVVQMCKRNSQQLLLMLIVQAQEFVVELKNRIKETLDDYSLTNVAEIFLTRILDGYDAFVSTAKQVTDLVKPVEDRHLLKFNLTWEFFNKALYENHIWMSEPSMRNVTGSFTTQLTKSRKRHSYQALFERYVAFVEEMMRVAELWPETERLIVKWNEQQTAERGRIADVAVDSTSHKPEKPVEAKIVEDSDKNSNGCENIAWRTDNPTSPRLTNGLCVNESTESELVDSSPSISLTSEVEESITEQNYRKVREDFLKMRINIGNKVNPLHELDIALRHKTDIVQEIASDLSESLERQPQRQMCQCIYEHMREVDETGRTWWSDSPCLCVLNLRWLCGVSKACPCLAAAPPKEVVTNERPESPTSTTHSPVKPSETSKISGVTTNSKPCQPAQKQTRHSTTQTTNLEPSTAITQASAEVAVTKASSTTPITTTQLPPPAPFPLSATQNHNSAVPHQGTCSSHTHFHGATPDLVKSTGPSRRAHTHNNHASHACHKQAKVEHIKRVLCNDLNPGDGDCSDSGSSHEDSSSTSSSTPRDSNRHCDCCYCEVFGPGVPSVAPVSRNYNEMRERLRQLLTKKKAKKCKTPCSPPKSPAESTVPASVASVEKKPACPPVPAVLRSNTPIPVAPTPQPEKQDERDLEALLEFIEGNQGTKKDNKKTEKKARQKQRKIEELLMKAKEEEEREKLAELQKKTPEVTITIVDPQKPVSQRLLPQRNLPEVSILPATTSRVPILGSLKQACNPPSNNSKKKDKKEVTESSSVTNTGKTKTGMISVTPINLNVFDFVVRERLASKRTAKSEGNNHGKVPVASKNVKAQPVASREVVAPDVPEVKLTKKERKRLRRQMKSLEEEKAKEQEQQRVPPQPESQPQIVTIKRVMESNSAEPTVTITLKGQTPADDKVLFTLVNGQTKELGSAKSDQQVQVSSGKKKKGKKNGGNSNQDSAGQTQQPSAKGQQQNVASNKSQSCPKPHEAKIGKQQQQVSNEKSKGKKAEEKKPQALQQQKQQQPQKQQQQQKQQQKKQQEPQQKQQQQQKLQQQQQVIPETKSTKSKKNQKNASTKQTVEQQTNNTAKSKNTQPQPQQNSGKKQNSVNTLQQNQGQTLHQNHNIASETIGKKAKAQQLQDKNTVGNSSNKNKNTESNGNKQSINSENQKNRTKNSQPAVKQQQSNCCISNDTEREVAALSNKLKDVTLSSKINIENLKLPPGITITKVDAPTKPLPIKSAPIPKPVTATKQTTIIAAPMSGVQSSYAGSQSGGNVIVVDTGKLKQDLLPKNSGDKDLHKDSQSGENSTLGKKKKKKKKGKNSSISGNISNTTNRGGNDSGKENGDEPARILHNPGSNMVTIRNPAFGPPPKIDPTPQAAIIKVAENGMVTIRSPALQQAINAGLTPPPKPDFIIRGDPSKVAAATSTTTGRTTLAPNNSLNHNNTNGIISSSFAELRSRLTSDCTGISGLANIHISKVTNGQPIPESGINLKGTSVTLTKVRSPDVAPAITSTSNATSMEEIQHAKSAAREAISASMHVPPGSGKSKKKKKRGAAARHCGDDWNLVESVFTPKDIDLEDGEMDDAERELEAFKRFCQQSVPPPRKEKVNLNIKDIVLKKKCSSSSSAAGAAIAAN